VRGEFVHQLRGAHVAGVDEVEIDRLADDAGVARFGGTDQVRCKFEHRVGVEMGREAVLRQLGAIALHARKADFQGVAVRAHGLDLHGFARWLRRSHHGLGSEVEGNAEHVGVFDVEQAVLIEVVGLAAQRATDDLFAQQLGAEGAHAEHVGDGVGIPALGKHGHRHHAANRVAQATGLADGVHHLAQ